MSELDENEERVKGRAGSLNFFEVIPSSLKENLLNDFFLSLPTHTCEVVCVGRASTGAMLGKLQYLLWSGSRTSRLGN